MSGTEQLAASIQKITEGIDIADNCEILVVSLRDENFRKSQIVRNAIPAISNQVVHTFSSKDVESLKCLIKVLVNSLANANRDLYIEQSELFWNTIISLIGEGYYAEVFILQFLRETDSKAEYATKMKNFGVISKINELLKLKSQNNQSTLDLGYVVEILVELNECQVKIDINDEILESYLWAFNNIEIDDDEKEAFAKLISSETYIENSTNTNSVLSEKSVLALFNQLEIESTNGEDSNLTISKYLFAAVGNISASVDFENWKCLDICTDVLKNNVTRSRYTSAAAQVILGNCVSDDETRNKLLVELNQRLGGSHDDIVKLILWPPKNDVIQYQGVFHLLRQIMTTQIANGVFKNGKQFGASCKVVIDNKNYYPEIYNLMVKCVKKLFTTLDEDYHLDISVYENIIEILQQDLQILSGPVGQKILLDATKNKDIISKFNDIICNIIKGAVDQKEMELTILLDKLKTIAIIFTKFTFEEVESVFNKNDNSFQSEFIEPYSTFLTMLLEYVSSAEKDANTKLPDIVKNNSAYIGAVGENFFSRIKNSNLPLEIVGTCQKLKAQNRQQSGNSGG